MELVTIDVSGEVRWSCANRHGCETGFLEALQLRGRERVVQVGGYFIFQIDIC